MIEKYYEALQKRENLRENLVGLRAQIKDYFADSYKEMVSFFAKEQKISAADLKDIINLIEKEEDK